jgi:ribosomal protein S18 acetylase RimI-like enzyme
VEVRRAGAEDLPDVITLWTQGLEEIVRLGRPTTSAQQAGPRLAKALAAGQIEILLARRDGRPAGFLILRESSPTFLAEQSSVSIDLLFVAPDARRHGVARALLSQVVGRAERSGVEQIVCSVTPWARDIHRFFARLGFSAVAVRRSVTPAALRRRLTGDRGGLEDLLSRRRSLRARASLRSGRSIVEPRIPGELGELGELGGDSVQLA